MISRSNVASYVAQRLGSSERQAAIRHAAAWLADGRRHEARYLAQDIASELAQQGYVAATVTSARPLDLASRQRVEVYIRSHTGASKVELVEELDAAVIGGVHIKTPTAESDQTVAFRLRGLTRGGLNE